ncbi:mobile element protein [Streptomyces sp. NL15-2K]|nr:mobile element protein [Streptomyces sp. NL15-2K]
MAIHRRAAVGVFHMHFTPTYSSWLNQGERWFGLLTDKKIRRGVHKNLQALERDIRAWIAQWNDDPKPFVWTKDADEIPQRLAAYLDRIPGAGHWTRTCLRCRSTQPRSGSRRE